MKTSLLTLFALLSLGLGPVASGCDSNDGNVEEVPNDVVPDQVPQDMVNQDGVVDSRTPDVVTPTDVAVDTAADVAVDTNPSDITDWVQPPLCPPEAPLGQETCQKEGLECNYGEECCCGKCHPSMQCWCQGGTFGCAYTDACMVPSCEQPCCSPSDPLACTEYGVGEHQCVVRDDWQQGRCLPAVTYPSCWSDGQCELGEACTGASACPCDVDCDMMEAPGTCTKQEIPQGCCLIDDDCDLGGNMAFQCAFRPGDAFGACLPLANGINECWDDGDCDADETCTGASFCPCGLACGVLEKPGQCTPLPSGLPCVENSQCLSTEVCVGATSCLDGMGGFDCQPGLGKCLPAPAADLCWTDADCGWSGDVCVNAVYCTGGSVCLINEHPGVCLPPAEVGCWADSDCPQPMGLGARVCTAAWVIPWWTGNDYDADPDHPGECCSVLVDECYQDSHCPQHHHCVGATYPSAGACAAGTAKPGTCEPTATWPEEFCLSDADCKLNQICFGEWHCPDFARCLESPYPGICLNPPTAGGSCYEDWNCNASQTCSGEMVCDVLSGQMCGALMAAPGECVPLPPAQLGEPCGQQGGECASGLACCYPCGMPGCTFRCSAPCDPSEPWCVDGCAMMP